MINEILILHIIIYVNYENEKSQWWKIIRVLLNILKYNYLQTFVFLETLKVVLFFIIYLFFIISIILYSERSERDFAFCVKCRHVDTWSYFFPSLFYSLTQASNLDWFLLDWRIIEDILSKNVLKWWNIIL